MPPFAKLDTSLKEVLEVSFTVKTFFIMQLEPKSQEQVGRDDLQTEE